MNHLSHQLNITVWFFYTTLEADSWSWISICFFLYSVNESDKKEHIYSPIVRQREETEVLLVLLQSLLLQPFKKGALCYKEETNVPFHRGKSHKSFNESFMPNQTRFTPAVCVCRCDTFLPKDSCGACIEQVLPAGGPVCPVSVCMVHLHLSFVQIMSEACWQRMIMYS